MQPAETISITLPPELIRALRESVEAGDYPSATEALSDAVRVWQRQRTADAAQLDTIRTRIRRSLDDPRPDLTSEQVRDHIRSLHTATVKAHRYEAS